MCVTTTWPSGVTGNRLKLGGGSFQTPAPVVFAEASLCRVIEGAACQVLKRDSEVKEAVSAIYAIRDPRPATQIEVDVIAQILTGDKDLRASRQRRQHLHSEATGTEVHESGRQNADGVAFSGCDSQTLKTIYGTARSTAPVMHYAPHTLLLHTSLLAG
jgi:hypothetical protein